MDSADKKTEALKELGIDPTKALNTNMFNNPTMMRLMNAMSAKPESAGLTKPTMKKRKLANRKKNKLARKARRA